MYYTILIKNMSNYIFIKIAYKLLFIVMRLTRPTLASPVVVTCDSTDLPSNTLNNELKNDCTALQGMEALAIGQFMVLPQSFGYVSTNIFSLQMFFTTLNK